MTPLAKTAASLGEVFLDAAARFPSRIALEVDGRASSYADLGDRARRLATLLAREPRSSPALGAVFASRSEVAYEAVLGTLLSGAGYVPLSPALPDARNAHVLDVSGSATLIVDQRCAGRLNGVLAHVERPLLVVLPGQDDVREESRRFARHRFAGERSIEEATPLVAPPRVDPDAIAYLLFTSGSSGAPKGVMVSHRNVLSHLAAAWDRYEVTEHDRFSQMFDLTFDLSVFDLFMSWGRGASLHCVPESALTLPDDFIADNRLTVWFSVPSAGVALRRSRRLSPGAFPSLRLSLFCGERLPATIAAAWQAAAPSSIVENLYGPTEVTIACTVYGWDPATSPAAVADGIVPIGRPFPEMEAAVVDDQSRRVAPGEVGELCMRGPQVALGYWRDASSTAERFVSMPWYAGPDNRWYRTGDLARSSPEGDLVHCGRTDDQVKLRGHRIELIEVEHALRQASGSDLVAVLPFPADAAGPTGLTAVIAGGASAQEIYANLDATLPKYMIPRELVFVDRLPLNANGKIDKRRLLEDLQERRRRARDDRAQ